MAELLATVAAEQLCGALVVDPIGEQVVEVLAAALQLVQQLQRGDVELLEAGQRGRRRSEVLCFRHRSLLGRFHVDSILACASR